MANEYLANEYLTNEDTLHYRREMFNIVIIVLKWSSISSSVVGTLAGQAVMDGLLGTKVNVWIRRNVTRFVNVIPTTITLLPEYDPLSILGNTQFNDTLAYGTAGIIEETKDAYGEFVEISQQ